MRRSGTRKPFTKCRKSDKNPLTFSDLPEIADKEEVPENITTVANEIESIKSKEQFERWYCRFRYPQSKGALTRFRTTKEKSRETQHIF